MKHLLKFVLLALLLGSWQSAFSQTPERVVDIPTRSNVTQRFLFSTPERPQAAVILFAGGDGGLELSQDGSVGSLRKNFLVRSRQLFIDHGLSIAVVDAPSDRQKKALIGFRQSPEHVQDIKAVIAWLKQQGNVPVWLVGTSRGTQSAAFIATELSVSAGGPDGVVLTSTMMTDDKGRAVPEMPLEKIAIPVLVVHHEQDGCKHCSFDSVPGLMQKLSGTARKELISVRGGRDQGDPCAALAHHGFNGLEKDVVGKIADWINAK